MHTAARIKILIVEDRIIVQNRLKAAFGGDHSLEVVDIAENGESAIRKTSARLPDVVIMDSVLPGDNGQEVIRRILQIRPDTKVIVHALYSIQTELDEMIEAGASGYLMKDCSDEELINAVFQVMHGDKMSSRDRNRSGQNSAEALQDD